MATLTLSIPQELKERMQTYPDINWSAVARKAISQRIEEMELFERIKETSTLTEEDAIRLGRELKERMAARYRSLKEDG